MESIGGYRIIRRLGSGSRADVFLGHAGHEPDGEPRVAAIKVFRDRGAEPEIDAEITALSRLSHPHILRMLDLATGPNDLPSLILQRLEPSGLARLLAERGSLGAGEAVTILAPLVAAVAAMHQAGVTHGRLGPAAVLFDGSGAPVLCRFGAADSLAPDGAHPVTPAQLDEDPRVAADLDALARLVALVLGRVRDPDARADEFTRWVGEQRRNADYLAQLERSLFAFAEPGPVAFASPPPSTPHRFDLRGVDGETPDSTESVSVNPAGGGVQQRIDRFPLPPVVSEWIAGESRKLPDWLVSRLAGVVGAIRSVRRKVWVVAAIGLAAVVAAIVLTQWPTNASEQATSFPEVEEATEPPVAPSVAGGDDPVAAAMALLELRAQCLAERSILCLDTVHQPDSAAWQSDISRIQGVQEGGELTEDAFAPGSITLVDRIGDTVLLALGPGEQQQPGNATASVLMIKTEAGWRIRSLLEGSAPLGG
ncbi:MAG TPA: protein kinase [Homoserinimonas sp.]|nr:protein kinase [Homoserinimonas sp.]